MKNTAFALALVLLALIWAHPLSAADTAPLSHRQAVAVADGCPVEEGALLPRQIDFAWRQPSLAHAAVLSGMTLHDPSDHQPTSLSVGAWFMGVGLVVFVISRKRFRS